MGKELISTERIARAILVIHREKVILDSDLAALYGVSTGNLNKAVKRNAERFPADFMFQLDAEEVANLKFQFGISSWGGRRARPYAFTEQGVAMLSSVLKSERAVKVNIAIMRAFVQLRELLATSKVLAIKIEKLEAGEQQHASILAVILQEIKQLKQPPVAPRRRIGFTS